MAITAILELPVRGILLASLLLTQVPTTTAGALYRWVDQDGKVYYSDQLPPSEAAQGHQELRPDGIEKRVVSPPKSREEHLREQETERLRSEQQRLIEKQQAEDRLLLEAFRTEDDILLTRDGKLAAVDAATMVTQSNLQRQKRQLTELQSEAAGYERRGQDIPSTLREHIMEIERSIAASYESIVRREQEKDRIRQAFDTDLGRFRALKRLAAAVGAGAKEPPPQRRQTFADLDNVVLCDNPSACQALWARAKEFVGQRATTPLQLFGPNIHMTALPKADQDLSLTLSLIANPDNQGGVLFLDLQCHRTAIGKQFCSSPAVGKILKDFKPFVQQPQ
jgi:hypothetical protein